MLKRAEQNANDVRRRTRGHHRRTVQGHALAIVAIHSLDGAHVRHGRRRVSRHRSTLIGTSIRPDGFRNDVVSGITLAVGGVVFGPIGFVMYGSTFHTGIEVEPRWNAAAPRAGVGLVVLPGGSGLGGSFLF